jgi:hypothetical protein
MSRIKVGQVGFVLGVELVIDAVVPALVPAEAREHVAPVAARHKLLHVSERGLGERQRLAIVLAEDGRVRGRFAGSARGQRDEKSYRDDFHGLFHGLKW